MKINSIWYSLVLFYIFGVICASNWSPQDYEIFNLNDKIKQDIGNDITFYSWLGLTKGSSSTLQEITKAYRKKSRTLHPDKVGGSSSKLKKQAEERFQRLSLVGNILRDNSLRQRYDYFLAKGFPKWKGTGYYYSKFRPGFFLTVFVLYLLISTLHMAALKISRNQDFKRIIQLKSQIKQQAWGGSQIPPADGSDRKIMNDSTGKQFLISADGEVNLIDYDENKQQVLINLDEHDINTKPGLKESLFFKLPSGLWNLTLGNLTSKKIDTSISYENTHKDKVSVPDSKKTKKKSPKGEKIELPNGKVIYGRSNNSATTKSRNRKQK